jgi:uncharacterized coiled-coil DUF342 family protein
MISNNDFYELRNELNSLSDIKDELNSQVENMINKIDNIIKKFSENYELTRILQDMRDSLANVDLEQSLDFISDLNSNLDNMYYKYRMDNQNNQLIYNPVYNIHISQNRGE